MVSRISILPFVVRQQKMLPYASDRPFSSASFAFETCNDLCATNHQMNQGMPPAATAVKGWIESPGHRKNLESDHSHCGIGVYQTDDGRYFLTQLFGLW